MGLALLAMVRMYVCMVSSDTSSIGVRFIRSAVTCPASSFSPFVLVESSVARRSFRSLPLVVARSLVVAARSRVAMLVHCRCVWLSRCCACGRAVAIAPLRVVSVVRAVRPHSRCPSLHADRLRYGPWSLVAGQSSSLRASVVVRYVTTVVVTCRREPSPMLEVGALDVTLCVVPSLGCLPVMFSPRGTHDADPEVIRNKITKKWIFRNLCGRKGTLAPAHVKSVYFASTMAATPSRPFAPLAHLTLFQPHLAAGQTPSRLGGSAHGWDTPKPPLAAVACRGKLLVAPFLPLCSSFAADLPCPTSRLFSCNFCCVAACVTKSLALGLLNLHAK